MTAGNSRVRPMLLSPGARELRFRALYRQITRKNGSSGDDKYAR